MHIDERQDSDLSACASILERVHAADNYPARWPGDAVQWISEPVVHAAWVCREGDAVVGHASLQRLSRAEVWPGWRDWAGERADQLGALSRLFVDPECRNRGVASALIERVQAAAQQRDLHVVLEVAYRNPASIAFYRRRGWVEVGEATLAPRDGYAGLDVLLFVAPDGTAAARR